MKLQITKARKLAITAVVLCCSACGKDSAVLWHQKVTSPAGDEVAVAEIIQNGGPRTASVFTTVDLHRADGAGEPVHILVLSNSSATDLSAVRPDIVWKDATHLEIIYPRGAELEFRADFYGGIAIASRAR